MTTIPWNLALAVFLGTLPLLGAVVWNLIDVRALRAEMRAEIQALRAELTQIRVEVSLIRTELTKITERVAILEERDRLTHPVIRN